MPKPSTRWFLLVSVLSVWMLSGCITTLAPIRALPREALASVTEVAMAMGVDGVKHYAWTECSGENATYTCVLVYSRVVMGAVSYSHGFVTPIGTFAQNPDVAVSSTGDAYVVRSECTAPFTCVDYWSMFPADHPENVQIDTQLLHTSALKSEDPPLVEARGNNVYAAYFVTISGSVRLRYRQLSGGARTGYIDTSLTLPVDPTLGIDSAGDLHAVWLRKPVTDTIVTYANNKGGAINFNAPSTFEGGGFDYSLSRPDLALTTNDRVYLAYANYTLDTIKVRCVGLALNCYRGSNTLTVPTVDGPWNVYRNPNLELINDQPNLVFAATNNSVVHNEVWWYRPPSTGLDTPPQQVSHTPDDSEGEPLIVKEHSTAGDVPVLAWRIFRQLIAGAQTPAVNSSGCWGDVFTTYSTPSNIRQVFEDRDTCDNAGLDLAASGPYVAGVWVDEESNQIAAHAAWTAFNAYGVVLPLVKR